MYQALLCTHSAMPTRVQDDSLGPVPTRPAVPRTDRARQPSPLTGPEHPPLSPETHSVPQAPPSIRVTRQTEPSNATVQEATGLPVLNLCLLVLQAAVGTATGVTVPAPPCT